MGERQPGGSDSNKEVFSKAYEPIAFGTDPSLPIRQLLNDLTSNDIVRWGIAMEIGYRVLDIVAFRCSGKNRTSFIDYLEAVGRGIENAILSGHLPSPNPVGTDPKDEAKKWRTVRDYYRTHTHRIFPDLNMN